MEVADRDGEPKLAGKWWEVGKTSVRSPAAKLRSIRRLAIADKRLDTEFLQAKAQRLAAGRLLGKEPLAENRENWVELWGAEARLYGAKERARRQ